MGQITPILSGINMHLSKKLRLIVAVLTLAQVSSSSYLTCEALNNADLQAAILKANVLNGANFAVESSESNAVVRTYLGPKDNQRSCRLKAVLLSKAIMDKAKEIKVVRCYFIDKTARTTGMSLEVHVGDVRSYGRGDMTLDEFLSSLPIGPGVAYSQPQSQASTQPVRTSTDASGIPEIRGDMNVEERQRNLDVLKQLAKFKIVDIRSAVAEWKTEESFAEKKDYANWFTAHNTLTEHLNQLVAEHDSKRHSSTMPSSSPIPAGEFQQDLTTILAHIQEKKKAGYNVSNLETRFNGLLRDAGDISKRVYVQEGIKRLMQDLR